MSGGRTRKPRCPFLESLAARLGIDLAGASDHLVHELRKLPPRRMNQPADVAEVVLFLAGDRSRQVTGSEYAVNAGSTALAAAVGVSRTPVREALRRLHAEGLVDWEANRGATVPAWNDQDLEEIFELRALLEGYGAELAAA